MLEMGASRSVGRLWSNPKALPGKPLAKPRDLFLGSLDAAPSLEGGVDEFLRSKGLRCSGAQNIITPPGSFDPTLDRYRVGF